MKTGPAAKSTRLLPSRVCATAPSLERGAHLTEESPRSAAPPLIRRISIVRSVAVVGMLVSLVSAAAVASASLGDLRPRMERTPGYVLGYCDRSRRLMLACPHL